MAGSKLGGIKAAETNKRKYGDDFYRIQGALGGAKSKTGGFYANRELARIAGAIGGAQSRKGYTGVEALGFHAYFKRYAARLNNYTAEQFLGMHKLGASQHEIADAIGRSQGLVSGLIRQARKEDLL